MIRVWRLCRAKHASAPLSGEGARLFGGRWNFKGTRMVYCAGTKSLACLEALVHLDISDLPKDFHVVGIDIPSDVSVKHLSADDLPADWNQIPGPDSLKVLGTDWIALGKEALLVVPSTVIPDEQNYLINPSHPDIERLKVLPAAPFVFDPRLSRLR